MSEDLSHGPVIGFSVDKKQAAVSSMLRSAHCIRRLYMNIIKRLLTGFADLYLFRIQTGTLTYRAHSQEM